MDNLSETTLVLRRRKNSEIEPVKKKPVKRVAYAEVFVPPPLIKQDSNPIVYRLGITRVFFVAFSVLVLKTFFSAILGSTVKSFRYCKSVGKVAWAQYYYLMDGGLLKWPEAEEVKVLKTGKTYKRGKKK